MIIKRNKILVVMPTRNRPEACIEALMSIVNNNSGYADVLLVMDPDDEFQLSMTWKRVTTQVLERRMPMLHALNAAIMPRLDHYDVFGFTGDDVRYLTKGWDAKVWGLLKHQIGIVYGDDGIQHENLPTHPWFSAGLVRAIGYAAPPCLQHYYFDNYLKGIGQALGILHYLPDLVTKHLHHSVGGHPYDKVYRQAEPKYQSDQAAFKDYQKTQQAEDIAKVKAWIEISGLTAAGAANQPGSHTPTL